MKNLDEAAYKGNIGVMELAKFHSKASPAQKSKFTELMRKKYAARNDVEEKRVADEIWDRHRRKARHDGVDPARPILRCRTRRILQLRVGNRPRKYLGESKF